MSGFLHKVGWKPSIKPRMGKSSAEERFTLLLVSSRGRSRTVGFGAGTLRVFAWVTLAAVLCLALFVGVYRANRKELVGLRYMQEVAESQKQQIQAMQEQYASLTERVRQAEAMEDQIRDMLSREGIIQQGYAPGNAGLFPAGRAAVVLSSRDNPVSMRMESPPDMSRALYALTADTGTLAEKAVSLEVQASALHGEVSEIVARLRATPSVWPVVGDISSGFGWRANPFDYYDEEYHSGIDIAASWGTPIVAPADGTVTFSGYKYGYGRMVIIRHGYGYETLYAHCSYLEVDPGQEVSRGEVIAYVGESGSATGPHLHYEVHLWGSPVDPTCFLPEEVLEVSHSVR